MFWLSFDYTCSDDGLLSAASKLKRGPPQSANKIVVMIWLKLQIYTINIAYLYWLALADP